MIAKDNERTSEGGHWYCRETGAPMYTIVGKNGKERNTTLRDARAHNLVPSVSGILKMMHSEGLVQWMQNEMLMSALTLPKIDGESLTEFAERVKHDAKETSRKAMQKGSDIHGSIEKYFGKQSNIEHPIHAEAVKKALDDYFGERPWESEISFAKNGYGGKCDLVDFLDNGIVVDFKTKDTNDVTKMIGYDQHAMQLSAYRMGFSMPKARCVNVFISVQEPVIVKIVEWKDEELQRCWGMFQACLRLWQLKNNYE
jgi:hypothetical protein